MGSIKMNFKLVKVLISVFIFSTALPAMANLITNGDFEDTSVRNGKWAWFKAADVNGGKAATSKYGITFVFLKPPKVISWQS